MPPSLAAQNHLATLSTNSVHRVIDGATHEALIADEEDAAATTQAILDVVSSVRSGRTAGQVIRSWVVDSSSGKEHAEA